MKLKKCIVCGRPSVEIDGQLKCLYCGRVWSDKAPSSPPRTSVIYQSNERAMNQAHKNLMNNIDGSLDYCLNRGITMYTIQEWKLGYVPANFELLPMSWWQRILFPIMSNDGAHVIGFGGRKTTPDDRAKYINSPASAIYKKSESLYGYHLIPDRVETIYLCEGYIDVLSMDAKGFAYPVASLGTALTKEQSLLIRQKASRVVICYDADEAGQKNALRAIDLLAKSGFKPNEITVFVTSDAKDVDEALQHGCCIREFSLPLYLKMREQWDMYADTILYNP